MITLTVYFLEYYNTMLLDLQYLYFSFKRYFGRPDVYLYFIDVIVVIVPTPFIEIQIFNPKNNNTLIYLRIPG